MTKRARDIMTSNPACCSPETSIDEVAKLMRQHDCGEIPVISSAEEPIGVVTDRDIVCRVVAEGKNPMAYPVEHCMSQPVVTVTVNDSLPSITATMEKHQIRRVPVVDDDGRLVGMIAQADIAWTGEKSEVAELVREISRDTGEASR